MDIKINVDVNVKLDDDTKGFVGGLIEALVNATEKRDDDRLTNVVPDPAARITKPRASKGKSAKAKDPTPKDPTPKDPTPKDPTHHETPQEPQGEAQAAIPKETPPPMPPAQFEAVQTVEPEDQDDPTPDTTQGNDSSPTMSDTEFRQEVSKVYLLAEGEAKPKVAKALYELLSKFEAPTVNKVDAEKRPEFLKMFTFVTNKLVKG